MRLCMLMLCVCMLGSVASVHARSIISEQTEAANARDTYRAARLKLEDLQSKIAAQEQRIKDEQARLQQLQKEEAATRDEMQRAEAVFEQKAKVLEKAWQERSQY